MTHLLLSLFCLSTSAHAERVQVAVVVSDDLEAYTELVSPFLNELGMQADLHNIHGREAEAEAVVQRLRQTHPEVVYCVGAKACYAIKNGMPNTPLVYSTILDPKRYGIVGEQVTGITLYVEPISFLSEFVGFFSGVRKIGVIRGPSMSGQRWLAMAAAAAELDLELVEHRVSGPREVRKALIALADQGVDALWVPPDRLAMTSESYRNLSEEARRRRLPLLVDTQNMVTAGGVFTIVPDPAGIARQAARQSLEIVDGKAPSLIKVQDPEKLQVVLNIRAVERAELKFDRLLLDFVDVVID